MTNITVVSAPPTNVTVTQTSPLVGEVEALSLTSSLDITEPGPKGDEGDQGDQGIPGVGVPTGGTTGQVLSKTSNTDFVTGWTSLPDISNNVIGPASATDNAIARFDATTGKLVQNSSATITDAGQLVLPTQGSTGGLLLGGDANLYRNTAGVLKTDGGLLVGDVVQTYPGQSFQISLSRTASGVAGAGITFGSAHDTNIYRFAADILATDDQFRIFGAAASVAQTILVSGDSTSRYAIFGDGKVEWGPGNATRDTNLYRSSADLLKTDDSMWIAGSLGVGATPGSAKLAIFDSRTSGSAVTYTITQTQPNATDTSDQAMSLAHTLSAASATNELVTRVFYLGSTNSLTGGGQLSNQRVLNLNTAISAGAVTDTLSTLYVEAGTYNGTSNKSHAININSMRGTKQSGLTINALSTGTDHTYLLLGGATIPAGNYTIYSTSTFASSLAGQLQLPTNGSGAGLTIGDTALYRSAAGILSLTGALSGRINSRIQTAANATSITPTADVADAVTQTNTQAAGTLTMNAPTGTPTDFQELTVRIKSTNVQSYSWNAIYRGSLDTALPVSNTGGGMCDYLKFIYCATDSKWDLVSIASGY